MSRSRNASVIVAAALMFIAPGLPISMLSRRATRAPSSAPPKCVVSAPEPRLEGGGVRVEPMQGFDIGLDFGRQRVRKTARQFIELA